MEVKALSRHTRTAPQKARLVAQLIRGKNVNDAMNILQFTRKKAARIIQKILKDKSGKKSDYMKPNGQHPLLDYHNCLIRDDE